MRLIAGQIGSGAYRDAGGTVTVDELSATEANLTLHLSGDRHA